MNNLVVSNDYDLKGQRPSGGLGPITDGRTEPNQSVSLAGSAVTIHRLTPSGQSPKLAVYNDADGSKMTNRDQISPLPVHELQMNQQKMNTAIETSPHTAQIKPQRVHCEERNDDDGDMVRVQSGKRPITNAHILRDHIHQIRAVFNKFRTKHEDLVQEQLPASGETGKNAFGKKPDTEDEKTRRIRELEQEME